MLVDPVLHTPWTRTTARSTEIAPGKGPKQQAHRSIHEPTWVILEKASLFGVLMTGAMEGEDWALVFNNVNKTCLSHRGIINTASKCFFIQSVLNLDEFLHEIQFGLFPRIYGVLATWSGHVSELVVGCTLS